MGREDRAGISFHRNVDATTLALLHPKFPEMGSNGNYLGEGAKSMRGSINLLAGRLQNAVDLSVLGLGRQVGLIGIFNPALSLAKPWRCFYSL